MVPVARLPTRESAKTTQNEGIIRIFQVVVVVDVDDVDDVVDVLCCC